LCEELVSVVFFAGVSPVTEYRPAPSLQRDFAGEQIAFPRIFRPRKTKTVGSRGFFIEFFSRAPTALSHGETLWCFFFVSSVWWVKGLSGVPRAQMLSVLRMGGGRDGACFFRTTKHTLPLPTTNGLKKNIKKRRVGGLPKKTKKRKKLEGGRTPQQSPGEGGAFFPPHSFFFS